MPIGRYLLVAISVGLLALVALASESIAIVASPRASWTQVSVLIGPAQAEARNPPALAEARSPDEVDWREIERFIAHNPGVLLGIIALPIILLLTVLARRRHYLGFSILIGAISGAAFEAIPQIATLTGSPILARLVQSVAAALVALVFALRFDLMFFIGRLSQRLILGKSLRGPDPVRGWFQETIFVERWAPSGDRTQEVDDAVARWHIALVTGAGALVASVLIQGHFFAGLHEHFSAGGFLTTSVILIAALYILEPLRERVLRLADPGHHEEGVPDSLVRTVINSPRRGWVLSGAVVIGAFIVQILIIGLEEAIHKAAPLELLFLAFSGLGPMPIAYFLCAALQKRLELRHAIRGTSAFSALLILTFLLMIAAFLSGYAGVTTANFTGALLGSGYASFTVAPLAGIAATLITCVILFWLSLGFAFVVGFTVNGLPIWLMRVIWPRTPGLRPLAHLALAIIIATLIQNLVIAPLLLLTQDSNSPGNAVQVVIVEPLAVAIGWLVGLWLSGIGGVLETYQKARPDLFPNLQISLSPQSAPPAEHR